MSHDNSLKHEHLDTGMGNKSFTTYIIGFVLSLILTIASFVIVGQHMFSVHWMLITISILAIVQLWVQVVFFLRMNTTKSGLMNVTSFIFALFVVFILIGGSLWIMHNLNYNMMH
jgi:cytochrome o ubiquinol oxidase subunit IV